MRRRFGRAVGDIEEPAMHMTPLIDVVFVILITFIVIAPLLEMDHIHLAAAPTKTVQTKTVEAQSPIAIYVHKDNRLLLNNRSVTSSELKKELFLLKAKHPKVIPQIFPDKQAPFGLYQEVKNSVEEVGFERMDVILQPK